MTTCLAITEATAVSALGQGCDAHRQALTTGRSGLSLEPFESVTLNTWMGQVAGAASTALPPALQAHDCRNNRLAHMALMADGFAHQVAQAASHWGSDRVGVFLGTSTSGILQTELAYRRRDPVSGALPPDFDYARTHNTYSVAGFVREALGLAGPALVVSTACSSGAKVFANAQRFIQAGWIDAAVIGGVDSLCLTTLYGFNSLELLSAHPAQPFDAHRSGLSIGEAAALLLLERPGRASARGFLLGVGESSDGHHMSAPHPEGAGAALAMRLALAQAQLVPASIDYVNLHGTATPSNDAAEDRAMSSVFGPGGVPCSSTKGATGHTLGAAGALEAVIALLAMEHGWIPGGLHRSNPDPLLQVNYQDRTMERDLTYVMSNSFGFGGTNASLVLGHANHGGLA